MDNQIQSGQTYLLLLESLIDGDKYGAEFISFVKTKHPNIDVKLPTIYSTLSRMEKQELVSSYWRDSDIGGKRHYYSITDFGKKKFDDKKDQLGIFTPQNDEKKYDEIGGFQKNDEGLTTNQISSQNFDEKNSVVEPKNEEKDGGIFLDKSETYYIPKTEQEKYDEIDQVENNLQQKDEGVFITDTMDEQQIPKVKKIASDLGLDLCNENNDINEKIIKPIQTESTEEKIETLYQKQSSTNFDESSNETPTKQNVTKVSMADLSNRYKNMDIDFYANPDENEKVMEKYGKIPSTKLFAKYFTIFMLILCESIGIWCLFFFTKGIVHYQFAYLILPIIFGIISLSILLSKKKYYKFEKQSGKFWIYLLIFVLSIVLLYSLNLLLGITFETILNFETTFIYPAVILTNILIAGIFDCHYAKKYS